MVSIEKLRVPIEKLRKTCSYEEELNYCSINQTVPMLDGVIGQERAVKSMKFGLDTNYMGYNIFVVGPGTGKSTYTQAIVAQTAAKMEAPKDWCYINNFDQWDKPYAVSLQPGKGREFKKDMERLIADLRVIIPKAFEGSEFEQKKDYIVQSVREKMESLLHTMEQEAYEAGFSVKQIPPRFLIIPMIYGRPIMPDEYEKIPAEERQKIEAKRNILAKSIEDKLHEGQMLEKWEAEQIIDLEKQTAHFATEPLVTQLKEKYKDNSKIVEYLDNVLKDIAENHSIFKSDMITTAQPALNIPQEGMKQNEEESAAETFETTTIFTQDEEIDTFLKYKVNLFIDNEKCDGAPVVIELSPYYYNLFGKIEYKSQMLSMSTNFTMVRPGALHRANGGYLILQAKDLLMDPFAWDALKKALKYRQATIENIGEQYRLVPTVTLKPEPIPMNVKIILIGTPLYYMLLSTDEDFQKLFKIKVDFDMEMERNQENLCQYVSFINSLCYKENLKQFSPSGLSKIIEFGSRIIGNQKKLSTHFNEISDIVFESSAIASTEDSKLVEASHVDRAIADRKYRSNMYEEKLQELIVNGTILMDVSGAVTGQINGLYVFQTADYSFGLPSRITARTYMGRGGIINIERETKMSGNIHSKGVLTLAGYLGGKLAQERQMGFTAQVTFEQLYDGIEGDSASSAELYAILSSLSGIPIRQNLAVTGSVNQFGEIQPIGGVTEKVEGFFDICMAKGLTGDQGVVIPVKNIDNLMLKDEILNAVSQNQFHIYAVNNIDEGIELLTGVSAGSAGPDGQYPEGSIFYLADKKLNDYSTILEAAKK
jgi:predicted ATP-dependent protease